MLSTPVRRLHVIGEDATLVPRALSIVELRHHTKVRLERRLAAVLHHRGGGVAASSYLCSGARRAASTRLGAGVQRGRGPQPVRPSVAVGHALLQQATPSTVLAGRRQIQPVGLYFIFLFSEYNQINANSKICTSLI
jgi:hypothetical protein